MNRVSVAFLTFLLLVACLSVTAYARSPRDRALNYTAPKDGPTERVYFYSRTRDEGKLLEVHRKLVDLGAHHVNCFLPTVVVCELPVGESAHALASDPDINVLYDSDVGDEDSDQSIIGPAWVKRCYATAEEHWNEPLSHAPRPDFDGLDPVSGTILPVPEETVRRSRTQFGSFADYADSRNIQQNSEIMLGTILVNLIFPESFPKPGFRENWSDASLLDATSQVTLCLRYFQYEYKKANMHFIIRSDVVSTGVEPIDEPFRATYWIEEIMDRLEYIDDGSEDRHLTAVHEFNNDRRTEIGTEWVFTAFIVDAERDIDHGFEDSKKAGWGFLGGPYIVLPYPPGDTSLFQVFKYYYGGIFWAVPEEVGPLASCQTYSGYLNKQNKNKTVKYDPIMNIKQGCKGMFPVMCPMNYTDLVAAGYGGPPCEYTAGMIGLSTKPRSSVPEALDEPPAVYFENAAAETVFASHMTIKLRVVSEGVPNVNPYQDPESRVRYRVPIKSVDRAYEGGFTQRITPIDGECDELEEEFEIELNTLPSGPSEFSVITRNNANSRSDMQTKHIFHIGLTYLHFSYKNRNDGNLIQFNLLGETFDACLDVHRVDLDGDQADSIICSDLEPMYTVGEFTLFDYFDGTVIPGRRYRYYVEGTLTTPYRDQDTTVTVRTHDVETRTMIPVPGGAIMSSASPNPFATSTLISVIVPMTYVDPEAELKKQMLSDVNIRIYDVLGRLVRNLYKDQVFGQVVTLPWDGRNDSNEQVPAGVYFIKVNAAGLEGVTKAVVVR